MARYRAEIELEGERTRRFRLLLYAALPDRFHAEVVPPVGAPVMIVDAGAGQLSVTFARDGVAFVGEATGEAVRDLLGVDLEIESFVAALLAGEAPPGNTRLDRTPRSAAGYPERFALRGETGGLALELKRLRPLQAGDRARLGTGSPPEGVRVRPLGQLSLEQVEAVQDEAEAPDR